MTHLIESSQNYRLKNKLTVDLWLLQDDIKGTGQQYIEQWIELIKTDFPNVHFRLFDFTEENVTRCIACDICPIKEGSKFDYHCIITTEKDIFKKIHQELISPDAIIPCAYSPKNRTDIHSIYQQFIERSRYLRRDHYAFNNLLTSPFIISEVGADQNLHIRMLTSFIRHHTVLHHPLLGVEYKNELINFDELIEQGKSFLRNAITLTIGRQLETKESEVIYNPLGYIISAQKHHESLTTGLMQKIKEDDLKIELNNEARIEMGINEIRE